MDDASGAGETTSPYPGAAVAAWMLALVRWVMQRRKLRKNTIILTEYAIVSDNTFKDSTFVSDFDCVLIRNCRLFRCDLHRVTKGRIVDCLVVDCLLPTLGKDGPVFSRNIVSTESGPALAPAGP